MLNTILKKNLNTFITCLVVPLTVMGSSILQTEAFEKGSVVNREVKKNRLAEEKSPYLLQHATNPVDWYPWSAEAFEKARREDKPIFLSIGYSTCHWCHVMEHESFEDQTIANYINEHFVAVKVDREERPDIDNIYMSAVQTMTGRGGWPLSVFLTPDQKPFFGGTYFPPYAKWGTQGFLDILSSIENSWRTNREKLLESSESLRTMLAERRPGLQAGSELTPDIFDQAYRLFSDSYDERFGGFGRAPKFPTSQNLSFLMRYYKRSGVSKALEMVELTLQKMADGGMYDHLGGGFHRYSTDHEWQIPHFEKMLYDQAILARTYLEAYQITQNSFYAQIAREIFDYCLRDLRDSGGAFHSAEDADSIDAYEYEGMSIDPALITEKKEGAFYLWTYTHIQEILGAKDAEIFNFYFGVKSNGNAKSDPHGEFIGKNVLFVDKTYQQTAKKFDIPIDEVVEIVKQSKEKLLKVRDTRVRSHLDDKVLVDWNGLLISSLAYGSRVLNEPRYLEAAEEAAQFILHNLIKDQRLLHRYREGESGIMGTLEDYAFFANGLIDLYEATFNDLYIEKAVELSGQMLEYFWDDQGGGFFLTADDAENLILRPKEIYDGAIPSGNSIAALVLVRLYHISFDQLYQSRLEAFFKSFSETITKYPIGYAQALIAFDFTIGPAQEIVIAGDISQANVRQMSDEIFRRFLPNRVLIHRPEDDAKAESIIKIAPFVKNQPSMNAQPTAYVCENHQCKQPTNDLDNFINILDQIK